MANFVYFVGSKAAKEVMVVDPAWEAKTILNIAKKEGLKIVGVLVSHFHYDHTNAIQELLKSVDCPVYIHKKDIPLMNFHSQNFKAVSDGDVVKVGDVEIKFIHTPGHTPGSQCFHVEDHIIAGDTLFVDACGRCDLPGGSAEELEESLSQKLMKLSDSTVLCPGHNYADRPLSTMGEQKKTNPYLR